MDGNNGDKLMLVGIGASAGGVEALMRFFERMPADTGLAFVVIVHLAPGHESRLAEVLGAKTGMPVEQVTEPVRVEPNRVYVVPPARDLYMSDGQIRLAERGQDGGRPAPIDLFFRTLADSYKERAIAVVLSGAGADGSVGVRRIKEEGGICLAQEPAEAEHPEMPRAAVETGAVDFVLPLAAMPEKLVSLRRNAERIQLPPMNEPSPDADERALGEVLALLRARTRHDFTDYKRSTLLRRVERRMQVTETEDLPAYLAHVREHPEELPTLLSDLLISVTNFFRDPETFSQLENEVVPLLFANKGPDEQVRVWVAGCATGEEAYSLAILLAERAVRLSRPPAIQVFASDIDEEALARAREGVYPSSIEADISPERLRRFFVKDGPYYRVKRELRELVLFAPHNILRDPPFSKLDLVSCRNLLIYINRQTQERVLEIFHFALRPGGHLFLGSSETAEGMPDLFVPVDKKNRLFRRLDSAQTFMGAPTLPAAGRWEARTAATPPTPVASAEASSYGELHYRTLEALAPPSVLVNADYEIVHASEHAGRFLRFAGGEPSRNLLKVAHPELQTELRSLLVRAEQSDGASRDVRVRLDGGRRVIRLSVRPVASPRTAPGFRLVVFEELPEQAGAREPQVSGDGAGAGAEADRGLEPVVRQLEEDLQRTREQLRATVEMYETQAEEFKAGNEELQAMNEELRSASEELETGKEELQSVNEELTTLNNEYKERVEEVSRTNSDLQNLMASTQVGTLFLDRHLRIKRYTPGVQELFNLIPGDVGRPVAHLTHRLDYTGLVEDAESVLRTLHTSEREAGTREGRHYMVRLMPYRTGDDRIDGVVVTFVDITERKRAEEALRESEEQFRRAIEDAPIPVIMQAEDGEVLQVSRTWTELTGYTIEDVPTFDAWLTRAYGEGADEVREHMHELFKGHRRSLDIEFPVRTRTGRLRRWSFNASSPGALRDGRRFVVGMALDITERHEAEERLRESEGRLQKALSIETVGVIFLDTEGTFTGANDAFLRMSGFTREEIDERRINTVDMTLPEWMPRSKQALEELKTEGRTTPYEKELRRPDGSRWWGLFAATRLGEADAVEYVIDVTERRRAEERLRESQERLQTAQKAGNVGVWDWDAVTGETYWSETMWAIYGYARPQESPDKVWESSLQPEDRPRVEERVAQLLTSGETEYRDEFRIVRPDGSVRWVEAVARIIRDDAGNPKRMSGVNLDFTERRRAEEALLESEERLRLVVESVEDYAIFTMDMEGRINSWNVGAERAFGYTAEEALGRHTEIIFTPEDRERGAPEEEMRRAREEGRAPDERWHISKGGARFYVSGVMVPLRDEKGAVTGYAKIARDLTERREMEDALRRAHDEMEERVRERTLELADANVSLQEEVRERAAAEARVRQLLRQLITVQEEERRRIARELHDTLGQQLAALHWSIELIRSKTEGQEGREEAERMRSIFDRLNSDVDFLAWELRPAALDQLGLDVALQTFVKEWSEHFGVEADYRGLGDGDPRPAPEVETNLYRILQEALQNVHTHAGATGVSVILERRDDKLLLIVEDNGRGYDPEAEEAAGTNKGMGVVNMRERAELLGGELEIESEPGAGVTIYVRVPAGGPAGGGEDA